MLDFDIFTDLWRQGLTLTAFALLILALVIARRKQNIGGTFCLTGALLLMFGESALSRFADFFVSNGVSPLIFGLTDMLLVLCSTVLLLISSLCIVTRKAPNSGGVFLLVSLGLIVMLYMLFAVQDEAFLSYIKHVWPTLGFLCTALAFASQIHFPTRLAPLWAMGASLLFAFLAIWPAFNTEPYPWFLPADALIVLAFAVYLWHVEKLQRELALLQRAQRQTAVNIENIVRSSPFPIMISRLGDDRLIMANKNAVKIFDLNENELSRYKFKDFFVDAENRRLLTDRLEKSREVQNFEILVHAVADQTPFWLLVSANIVDYENDVVLYTAFQNITDRKRREDLLQTQADRDPLTSVFNRRYFETNLTEKIAQAHAQKKPFAVLMLDADHFKHVNDTFGHKIGDKVLMELAAVCERQTRTGDMVARYGGEEFVVYLDNVAPDVAVLVANRLREAVKASVVYTEKHEPVSFSVSIGVAPSGISDNGDRLIKMADDAMYLAKQSGRNRVELYEPAKIEAAQAELCRRNQQKDQLHPVYTAEDEEVISLLDGIESQHIMKE